MTATETKSKGSAALEATATDALKQLLCGIEKREAGEIGEIDFELSGDYLGDSMTTVKYRLTLEVLAKSHEELPKGSK